MKTNVHEFLENSSIGHRHERLGQAEPAQKGDCLTLGEQGEGEAADRVQEDSRGEAQLLREHGATHVCFQDVHKGRQDQHFASLLL